MRGQRLVVQVFKNVADEGQQICVAGGPGYGRFEQPRMRPHFSPWVGPGFACLDFLQAFDLQFHVVNPSAVLGTAETELGVKLSSELGFVRQQPVDLHTSHIVDMLAV
jgi:hypothetical protein